MVTLTLFATHGAFFIALKTDGVVRERANHLAGKLGLATALLAVVFLGWLSLSYSDKTSVVVLSAVIVVAWLSALEANRRGREGWAFLFSAVS